MLSGGSMRKSRKFVLVFLTAFIMMFIGIIQNNTVFAAETSVKYRTNIQSKGWTEYSYDGSMSGSVGQALRLEAIDVDVINNDNLGIKYSVHLQDFGWQDYKSDGALSGAIGEAKRLEAIKIELFGDDALNYDVFYRVHAQNLGWLSWTKNGYAAGTEGFAYRLEAIEIKLYKKGDPNTPDVSGTSFKSKNGLKLVEYTSHVQNKGWLEYSSDGELSGTEGLALRMEAFRVKLSASLPSGSIVYKSHVQNVGWMSEVSDGAISGIQGESKRVEALTIRLNGTISNYFGVEYRTHVQNLGWTDWKRDGEISGTTGKALRIEAIEIRLFDKSQPPVITPEPEPEPEPEPPEPTPPALEPRQGPEDKLSNLLVALFR